MVGYVSETKQNKNRTALLTETTKVRPNQIRDFPGNEALDSLFQARSDALKQFKRGVGPNIGQKTNSEHNTEKKKKIKKKNKLRIYRITVTYKYRFRGASSVNFCS